MTQTQHSLIDYAAAVRAGDIADFCDRLIDRANAGGTGLGGPDEDPSPSVSALRAPSLSQVPSQEKEAGGQ